MDTIMLTLVRATISRRLIAKIVDKDREERKLTNEGHEDAPIVAGEADGLRMALKIVNDYFEEVIL